MASAPTSISDMLVTVKSREVQRGRLAEMRGAAIRRSAISWRPGISSWFSRRIMTRLASPIWHSEPTQRPLASGGADSGSSLAA